MTKARRSSALLVLLVLLVSACSQEPSAVAEGESSRRADLVVGSFDFTESRILAHVFGTVLRHEGVDVEVAADIGSREVVEPALEQGLIDLVPEYQGAALAFLSGEASPLPPAQTHEALTEQFASRGVDVLGFAPAQNRNEIVVTRDLARQHRLRTISDLAPIASGLVFGGPPECEERPTCLKGLETVYDLHFKEFMPLQLGASIAADALRSAEVDVALLFTTDPEIALGDLFVLRDDKRLQPAENIVLVGRSDRVKELGADIRGALDDVTAKLTTPVLRELNAEVEAGADPAATARRWLEESGLLR